MTATYRTDEFGVLTLATGSSTQPYRFTGEPRDGTGLSYLRARYYDPGLGRFMSRDGFAGVSAQPGTLNRYSYVQANPTTLSDPSGLKAKVLDPDAAAIWDCFQGGIAPMHSCDSYRRLTAEKAAARRPDCGPLGTRCLKDLAAAVSAGSGSTALAIEIGTGGLGTPVSFVLGGISVLTGLYSTIGTCAYDGAGQCVVSGLATAFSAAAPVGGGLKAFGIVGRDVEVAWRLTWQFMAQPFTLTGPLLWLHEVSGR